MDSFVFTICFSLSSKVSPWDWLSVETVATVSTLTWHFWIKNYRFRHQSIKLLFNLHKWLNLYLFSCLLKAVLHYKFEKVVTFNIWADKGKEVEPLVQVYLTVVASCGECFKSVQKLISNIIFWLASQKDVRVSLCWESVLNLRNLQKTFIFLVQHLEYLFTSADSFSTHLAHDFADECVVVQNALLVTGVKNDGEFF